MEEMRCTQALPDSICGWMRLVVTPTQHHHACDRIRIIANIDRIEVGIERFEIDAFRRNLRESFYDITVIRASEYDVTRSRSSQPVDEHDVGIVQKWLHAFAAHVQSNVVAARQIIGQRDPRIAFLIPKLTTDSSCWRKLHPWNRLANNLSRFGTVLNFNFRTRNARRASGQLPNSASVRHNSNTNTLGECIHFASTPRIRLDSITCNCACLGCKPAHQSRVVKHPRGFLAYASKPKQI